LWTLFRDYLTVGIDLAFIVYLRVHFQVKNYSKTFRVMDTHNKQTNGSALVAPYQHRFAFPFEQGIPDDYVTQLLIRYWPHTIIISAIYLVLVYSIQWLMRDRKPFDLKRQLFFWNSALALFSIFG
jgi:hypothetical protein